MAIFGTSFVLILLSIIVISVPSSTSHKITDHELKHLCSKTSNDEGCYKLLKSDHRTANVDEDGLADVSIDLASKKAHKIHAELNSFAKATHDSQLRNRYNSCTKNYYKAIHHLEGAKNYLTAGADKEARDQAKAASKQIRSCKEVIDVASGDHAHIKKENQEFEFLVSIVEAITADLNKK